MVSYYVMAGLITAAAVCLVLPIGLLVYCIRKNRGERLFMPALMGFAVMLLANSFSGLIMSIEAVAGLSTSAVLLYILLGALVLGLFDAAGRWFVLGFMKRTGSGYYKVFAAGAGMGAGLVLIQAGSYVQFFNQAQMINNGSFQSMVVEQGVLTAEEALQYQQTVASIHPAEYFVTALDHGAIVILEVVMALLMVRLFSQGKKWQAFLITAGIRFAYEFIIRFVYVLPSEEMNGLLNATASKIISIVLLILFIAASVLGMRKLKPLIPEVEGTLGRAPGAPARQEERAKEHISFQQIREMNLKNLGETEAGGDEAAEEADTRTEDGAEEAGGDRE